MRLKKLVIPFALAGLIFLGFQAYRFFSIDETETSLSALRIDASTEGALTQTDLLILVNKDNKLPDNYKVDLATIGDVKVANVLADDLKEMRDAAENDNVQLYIASAHRSTAEQEQIFNDATSGTNGPRAENTVAHPGYSEHETGLAMDFSFDGNDTKLNEMWVWLSENAHTYGFILRYPDGKRAITGYKYEPWHYRYVGKEHAAAMFEQGLTLEEYTAGESSMGALPR
jgi:zinc D-Ala-D-Ala carboxypeptidase